MSRPRTPWWLYLAALSFLGVFLLQVFLEHWGPEPIGLSSQRRDEIYLVTAVSPGSAAARAGLRAGDRLLTIGGWAIKTYADWLGVRSNLAPERTYRVEIEREGQSMQLALTPERKAWRKSSSYLKFLTVFLEATNLFVLALAFFIAFQRPHDPAARVGAWLLAGFAIAMPAPPYGMAVAWRELPFLAGLPLWFAGVSNVLTIPLLFAFCATFPRKLFHSPWLWRLIWLPAGIMFVVFLPYAISITYFPAYMSRLMPEWGMSFVVAVLLAYFVAAMIALILNYRRLPDINEKRRVRVIVGGALIAWIPVAPYAVIIPTGALANPVSRFFLSPPYQLTAFILFLAFPLSFAYAILRHRLFDIRVIIRQGLQYALARRALAGLVPFITSFFVLDLVFHGDQPLLTILRERGWIYAVVVGLAFTAHFKRGEWLAALDRRYFRERYDANQILRETVEEIRRAKSFEEVALRVVVRVEAALHPEFTAIMMRAPHEPCYSALAAVPAGQAPASLPAESKFLALVRILGKTIELPHSTSGWLQQQLPDEEIQFLRSTRLELVVPVALQAGGSEALLVLGAKRSEEPYSREDRDLLGAIAASLAFLLEQSAALEVTGPAIFEECPKCGECYDSGWGRCARDAASLTAVALPRTLSRRYRLERRLGRGGMGTVYLATDSALERPVAVKLIADSLVGSAEAAERFRREARASASFSHPNVVTVHDYGVVAGTRAFLVMELLSGVSLREELRRERRLSAARTIEILRGVVSAIEAAHRRQLVHRDLKPENIFLARSDAGEVVKVLDFGLAKFLPTDTQVTQDTDTDAGILVGTLRYMAPEQIRGEPVNVSWDVWALGVTSYEMLTGALPFSGATRHQWYDALLSGSFTPVGLHVADAPPQWQEFFARVFSPDWACRPNSVGKFLEESEQALASAAAKG